VSGAYSISSVQTIGEAETIPRLQYAKPLIIDFGRDPRREPFSYFSTPVEGQEAEITPLFSTADELAARAPATCSSEFLLYADAPVRIPGLTKASFLVPAPLAVTPNLRISGARQTSDAMLRKSARQMSVGSSEILESLTEIFDEPEI